MKRQMTFVGLVAMAGLLSVGRSWSQNSTPSPSDPFVPRRALAAPAEIRPAGPQLPPEVRPVPPGVVDVEVYPGALKRRHAMEFEARNKFRDVQRLADELKNANEPDSKIDEKKKAELAKQLEAAVSALFDSDMADREHQLARLERKLKNLRSLLDRRRQAKAQIVGLEVEVLTNEAAGLGFSARGEFGLEKMMRDDFGVARPRRPQAPPLFPDQRD